MKFRYALAILTATASLYGCTTSSGHGVMVPLNATRQNAGEIGNVTLADWDKQTGLSFFISGIPNGTSLPLRIYSFIYKGSCQQPGPVAYAMNDRVNTERQAIKGWAFSRSVPVPMATLLSGGYSIVVRSAPPDGNVDLFCGDIPQAATQK
ncbi:MULTISPECIES: hypothetical protein [Pseudomonas]|uniref:Lipoprotein n=1 Tax=Pseudomonas izuensis TaxID=2684212 RepID=A0ABM7S2V9_9PSED|nr:MULTISPECIES: hypothetical protein [Pseudomonas]RKS28162.1 hypothetical protein BJ917_1031 [Pseudomonas sp. WPR_5_2]BCX68872.1 hypothetical protein LAB08_R35140 [Pseudomonas izuensis]